MGLKVCFFVCDVYAYVRVFVFVGAHKCVTSFVWMPKVNIECPS